MAQYTCPCFFFSHLAWNLGVQWLRPVDLAGDGTLDSPHFISPFRGRLMNFIQKDH